MTDDIFIPRGDADLAEHYRGAIMRMMENKCSPETQQNLLPAVEQLVNAIEQFCPVGIYMTGRGAVATVYGPDFQGRTCEFVVIAASQTGAMVIGFDDWPEIEPIDDPAVEAAIKSASVWSAICDCIADKNADAVVRCLLHRWGPDGVANVKATMAALVARGLGWVPALICLAGKTDTRAGGSTFVLPLPAPIHLQIAKLEAAE